MYDNNVPNNKNVQDGTEVKLKRENTYDVIDEDKIDIGGLEEDR